MIRVRHGASHSAVLGLLLLCFVRSAAHAFEGEIEIATRRGAAAITLLYTVSASHLRIEVQGNTTSSPVNIIERESGALTLLLPHNRVFMRMKSNPPKTASSPSIPLSAISSPAAVPMMPSALAQPKREPAELRPTGETERIMGYLCAHYEMTRFGEKLEVWATDRLLPFEAYVGSVVSRRTGPMPGPMNLAEAWPELLKTRKLFPLRLIVRTDRGHGSDRELFHLEVTCITEEALAKRARELFEPPPDYRESEPLPTF